MYYLYILDTKMDTKKYKTILTKDGYLLNKKKFKTKELDTVKNDLTVQPQLSYSVGVKNKLEKFEVYKENDEFLSIPKYYGISKFGKPDLNEEIIGESINYTFGGELRPLQKDIVNSVMDHINKYDGGGICVGCGSGKTVMAINISCKLKVKTLIIVHKTFLLNQWKERFEQFTNAKVGIIQQNKIDTDGKDVVIGMLQSIAKEKYDLDIFRDFGLVVFDEAHHAPSKFFSKALPIISCKKTLFLTATPKRSDKLEKVLYWYFGDIIYKAPPNQNQNVLAKIYKYDIKHEKFRETYIRFTHEVNRAQTISRISKISKRNKFIVDLIKDILDEDGRKVLVLSDRIEHLTKLKEKLDKKGINNDFYIGGMKQAKLDIAAEATVILASYGMASEALDIPTLNTLIMATPRRNIEQSVGRILRTKNHEVQPLIVDIVDQLKSFNNQGMARRKFYKKLKYSIKLIDVEENEILAEEDISDNINACTTGAQAPIVDDDASVDFLD
jgi:superfamily II DNA or RNA helicase